MCIIEKGKYVRVYLKKCFGTSESDWNVKAGFRHQFSYKKHLKY